MEKLKDNSQELFHNTELLLKNYLNIKKFVKNSGLKTKRTFRKEFDIKLEDYLDSESSRMIDFAGTKTQREANKYVLFYSMIWHLEQAIKELPNVDRKGLLYQTILIETYCRHHLTVNEIVTSLSEFGIKTTKTYYEYRKKAITVLGQMIWGFADQELIQTYLS